jgi:hypothetical protein
MRYSLNAGYRSVLIAALAVAAPLMFAERGTAAAPPTPPAVGLQSLDIPLSGGTVTMMAPAGAFAKISFGSTFDIAAGRTFELELGPASASLARTRQEILANNRNVFKRYVVDEPAGMVYETTFAGAAEYHVFVAIPGLLGGLACQDTKGPAYTEAQARAMYAACKSVALKP